jgi:hypothetical protein
VWSIVIENVFLEYLGVSSFFCLDGTPNIILKIPSLTIRTWSKLIDISESALGESASCVHFLNNLRDNPKSI